MGRSLDEARGILERYGLRLGRVDERPTDRRSAEGRVADQAPGPGKRVPAGTPVNLSLWRYRQVYLEMPMLLKRPLEEAQRVLKEAGIRLDQVNELKTDNPDLQGRVVRQSPRPGARLGADTRVVLGVYRYERRPAPLANVPRVVGIHIDKARAMLERAGLRADRIHTEPPPSRAQIGVVFRQNPGAGTGLAPGSAVDLWIFQPVTLDRPILRLPQAQPLE
jgi:beta-lactam-binding protein with PASTA domain